MTEAQRKRLTPAEALVYDEWVRRRDKGLADQYRYIHVTQVIWARHRINVPNRDVRKALTSLANYGFLPHEHLH